MKVYEILECEEYEWQVSHGLFVSEEAARQAIPGHISLVYRSDNGDVILALPEHADEVTKAWSSRDGYWWYSLPNHGRSDTGMTFYAIIGREVHS